MVRWCETFIGQMPFPSPNQHCHSTEGRQAGRKSSRKFGVGVYLSTHGFSRRLAFRWRRACSVPACCRSSSASVSSSRRRSRTASSSCGTAAGTPGAGRRSRAPPRTAALDSSWGTSQTPPDSPAVRFNTTLITIIFSSLISSSVFTFYVYFLLNWFILYVMYMRFCVPCICVLLSCRFGIIKE